MNQEVVSIFYFDALIGGVQTGRLSVRAHLYSTHKEAMMFPIG
jgi:hypothetical protein